MRLSLSLPIAGLAIALLCGAAAPNYLVTGSIKASDGGWDYARVDTDAHKLYVARGTDVTEVDLAKQDAVRSFGSVAKGHAVVPIPGHKLLLVTSGHDDTVRLFETDTGQEVAKISVGGDPDAAVYDPASGLAAVMNAKSGTISVIDVAARSVVRTIALKPGLEYAQLGEGATLFVNNEDENEIETANLKTGAVGPVVKLNGCTGPTGLALDAKTGALISACANGKAAVVDAKAKQLVKLLDIGAGPDAVILDAPRRLAFIPCGRDGTLTVIALDGPGAPAVTGSVKTGVGARTGALDPATGKLYLPTADFGPAPASGGRPAMVPGSFHILVVSSN